MKVDFNNLKRSYELYQNEYEEKVLSVLRSGWYVLGKEVREFEASFAVANGAKHCVGVDNGLNAIILGLRALGICKGDEVIVQSNGYIATVMGISANGATPIFVEPDEFYNMDVSKIEGKITSRTKAVLITHLYGQASNVIKIKELCDAYNLILLEDCAQAHFAQFEGKFVGTFGEMGFFSFYPTKNLGAFGDGGAIITNNEILEKKLQTLRNYGSDKKYNNQVIGYNARLDELQAGLLSVKLKHMDEIIERRREIADRYLREIINACVCLPETRNESTSIWHLFVVRVDPNLREDFRKYLLEHGIATDIHYPIPPHLSMAYKELGYKTGDFPIAENYANSVVSLPIFDGMKMEEVEKVIDITNKWKLEECSTI